MCSVENKQKSGPELVEGRAANGIIVGKDARSFDRLRNHMLRDCNQEDGFSRARWMEKKVRPNALYRLFPLDSPTLFAQ
jgi:hypothetical protein